MRVSVLILLLLTLTACAETDPYKRLDPAPTPPLEVKDAAAAFNRRWPEQFKCVQTVTLDFGVQTRTLVGYLALQQPGSFRLQGMSEQGLKLFDIAVVDGVVAKVFGAEEFDANVLENIARDIGRVFLGGAAKAQSVRPDDGGTRVEFADGVNAWLVGARPVVDWYELRLSDRKLYRVNHYEWQGFEGEFLPSVIVLREPGIQTKGPPYKLTIKITEFATRNKPWPDALFQPKEGG